MAQDNANSDQAQTDKITPTGSLAEWSETDIEAMATINAVTLADARADAIRADAKLAALLEAKAE